MKSKSINHVNKILEQLASSPFIKRYNLDLEKVLSTKMDIKAILRMAEDDTKILFLESPLKTNDIILNALFKEINISAFSDFDIKEGAIKEGAIEDIMVTLKFYVNFTGWSNKEIDIPLGYGLYEGSTNKYTFTPIKDADPDMIKRGIV